jgi:Antirestriction protein
MRDTEITQTLVAEKQRMTFLPRHFGPAYMVAGEALVYTWMGRISVSDTGGLWDFFELSNGGFYLAPTGLHHYLIDVSTNGFEGTLSARAAGIVATLFSLNQLTSARPYARSVFNEKFHLLLDFVDSHKECSLIYAAID